MIKAILACDETGGVGKGGTLPWPNNPKDLQWFKNNTAGHTVVMGSKTWEDPHMPRPLPNRFNILVTSRPSHYNQAHKYINKDAVENIKKYADENSGIITWIIGGPNLVEQCLGIIDEFYISRIPGDWNCDTHLPVGKINTLFEKTWDEVHPEVTFEVWKKRETIS